MGWVGSLCGAVYEHRFAMLKREGSSPKDKSASLSALLNQEHLSLNLVKAECNDRVQWPKTV